MTEGVRLFKYRCNLPNYIKMNSSDKALVVFQDKKIRRICLILKK